MLDKIRLAGIAYESLVNGPGLRRVYFAQGCSHNCRGCFNPSTHNFEGGQLFEIDKLISSLKNNPMIHGITFSGGDPFYQAKNFNELANRIKALNRDLSIWCYTGFTFDEIINSNNTDMINLLKNIDVLVDGKFVLSLKEDNLKFKGSSNQRIIDIKKTLEKNDIILWEE